jgi:polyhydroxyalkanoate synthesis regulator protein
VSSTYVSLDDLANMVLNRERFIVLDAQTGNDITREILNRRD